MDISKEHKMHTNRLEWLTKWVKLIFNCSNGGAEEIAEAFYRIERRKGKDYIVTRDELQEELWKKNLK